MHSEPCYSTAHRSRGFSLLELSIVLLIVGTLMSGVLVAVSRSAANARITDARAQLREIEEALYGYAQAYGRLPCPTTPTTTNKGFADPATGGACAQWHGFVPHGTLNLSGPVNDDGLLLDPWGNPFRYSVSQYRDTSATAGTYSFTSPSTTTAGLKQLFNSTTFANLTTGTPKLRVCDTPTCTGVIYSDAAPAVVLSMGANWASYSSADEQQNAGNGSSTLTGASGISYRVTTSNDFVSTTYSEDNFDDQVVWLSPYLLINRLVSAGKLP